MKLLMAVSKDGFVARSSDDDMSWLGAIDKAVFRILTGVGGVVGCSLKTAKLMPKQLPGRQIVHISRCYRPEILTYSLAEFNRYYPGAWLIGGPTLAIAALANGYIKEVHLCRSDRQAFPAPDGIPDFITDRLRHTVGFDLEMKSHVLDVTVECWKKHG